MKHLFKTIAIAILGRELIYRWWRALRRTPKTFSEIDLIAKHFQGRKIPGIMLDVGAHHGESLEAFQNWGWRILAFEPDPSNRDVLMKRVDTRLVEVLPLAVADREEDQVPFYASVESDGISSLSAFRNTHRESARVRVTTLSTILKEKNITNVDYLKIDTEGHDLFVLKGFPWERVKPEVVVCEFEDSKTVSLGYDHKTLGEFLLTRGYKVYLSEWSPIVRYGESHTWRSWRSYPCVLQDTNGWGNFVAVHPECDESAMIQYVNNFTDKL